MHFDENITDQWTEKALKMGIIEKNRESTSLLSSLFLRPSANLCPLLFPPFPLISSRFFDRRHFEEAERGPGSSAKREGADSQGLSVAHAAGARALPRSSINLCVCQLEMVIFLALRMNWRQREIRVEAFLCFALADTKEGKTRKPRKAAWTEYLVHGRKICRKTFSFLHGMSDTTLKRVSGHYDKFGLKKRFETHYRFTRNTKCAATFLYPPPRSEDLLGRIG